MLKIIRGFAIASALALSGCGGGSSLPNLDSQNTAAQIQNIAAQVKSAVEKACRFEADYDSIIKIVATFAPGGNVVAQAANSICRVVNSKGVRRGGVMRVRGVVLRGQRSSR